MKGHKLHVRRKMKKIEASLIKRLLRISWQALGSIFCLGFGARKGKASKGRIREGKEGKEGSRKEKQDQVASIGIIAGNILHV